ncbi:MAG: clostripain, partial [Selenomonadaceae bacterium]|nr:clostripain [Selenomonadaceae bacterium]
MKKILGAIVMLLILFFVIVAMSDDTEEPSQKQRTEFADSYNKNDTWLIYWYICGSNLESEYGAATADIEEMMKVA